VGRSTLANQIKHLALSAEELEFICGCLIGDGTLSKSGKEYRLRIEHSSRHWEYVEWKYQKLRRLISSEIQHVVSHSSVRMGTVGHPEISNLRNKWYCPAKTIPNDFVLTPLTIAIWFMDDGTKHRDTIDISVHNFSVDCLTRLLEQLKTFNITATINSDGKGKRLYILKSSYPTFKNLVKPYILSCMAYKLP
jgi:hypothetical protein